MKTFTDSELLYAATDRCRCGAGLAYPLDHAEARKLGAWVCSAQLKIDAGAPERHESFHWSMYKIREETSINNTGGHSTRLVSALRALGLTDRLGGGAGGGSLSRTVHAGWAITGSRGSVLDAGTRLVLVGRTRAKTATPSSIDFTTLWCRHDLL